jgi:hypothetical protein
MEITMATKSSGRAAAAKQAPRAGRSTTARKQAPLKDPRGGLTPAGRAYFAKQEGAHLKPGVTKPTREMSAEDMKRKGSFLRRHFAHPRGPLQDEHGKPTRLALSAHAWGEPVPKTAQAAARLAKKGERLLEAYARSRKNTQGSSARKTTPRKSAAKKSQPARKRATARAAKPGPVRRKSR